MFKDIKESEENYQKKETFSNKNITIEDKTNERNFKQRK